MGTRGSPLALAQSALVADALGASHRGLEVERVVIRTSGDLHGAPSPEAAISVPGGAKGLFVKEIQEAVRDGRVDFAVHSAKDLPAASPGPLAVAAYPRREDPRDVFIGGPGTSWRGLGPGGRIGTSSLRRSIQAARARPGVVAVPLRGNVDTRLRKLGEGLFDGLILALAGLRRLGLGEVPHEALPVEVMLPAPAQGALALEARRDRRDVVDLLRALDHGPTRTEVELERAFLAAAGGGCSTPLGALARAAGEGAVLEAFWARPDGSDAVRLGAAWDGSSSKEDFALSLARRLPSR